jgi:hypothetical protein
MLFIESKDLTKHEKCLLNSLTICHDLKTKDWCLIEILLDRGVRNIIGAIKKLIAWRGNFNF